MKLPFYDDPTEPEEAAVNNARIKTAPCLTGEFEPTSEIAVPVLGRDRSDPALTLANDLATRWGVGVHIVHVRLPDDPVDNDRLEAVRAAFAGRHPGTEVESTLVAGDSVPESLIPVIAPKALIVMRSEHASEGGSASVAEGILRMADGPCLITGVEADHEDLDRPVLAALDGSPTSERALDTAVAFAESINQRLVLVQVVTPAISAHVAKLRSEGQQVSESGHLRSVAQRLGEAGHQVGWEIVHTEDAVAGILGAARRLEGGVIVLGTHGDSGLARRMLGSTAMGLVAKSSSPVLVVTTGGHDEVEISM